MILVLIYTFKSKTFLMIFKNESKKILVTGGAGFIGSALICKLLEFDNCDILNLDKLGYASDLTSIKNKLANFIIIPDGKYKFAKSDLCDLVSTQKIITNFQPDIIFNLAAETHVDRSIDSPSSFINNNIVGTYNLLDSSLIYWNSLNSEKKKSFRLIHISTDEVFGSLGNNNKFTEKSPYLPSSPYSASKASSDFLVKAWNKTFNLPTITTNCSNNYGPWQYPEKLIPNTILKACLGKKIPVYGNGNNIRDWLFVDDHINALLKVAEYGKVGSNYCIGGECEKSNIEVVKKICNLISELQQNKEDYSKLITFVKDRPGHDFRYSVDISKIKKDLKWFPKSNFEEGLKITIKWYLENLKWCTDIYNKSGFSGNRLGLIE